MIRVLLEAPILTQSGYGEHSRLVFRALEALDGVSLFINPLNWGRTGWTSSFENDENNKISSCIADFKKEIQLHKNSNSAPQFDVQIHVGILNEFEKKAPYSVCVTAGIEVDRISPDWLSRTWKGVNKIIVPSEHAKLGFTQTNYVVEDNKTKQRSNLVFNPAVDLEVVPYPVKNLPEKSLDLDVSTDFNFLSIALLGPRKNLENMVIWFIEEFRNENVGLILKTGRSCGSLIDRIGTSKHFKQILKPYKDRKCKIYLLHGDLNEDEIHSLYMREDVKCYINIAHGEGFGLPIFEAAYSGVPVIATDWSGHLDFLSGPLKEGGKVKTKKLFAKVDFDLAEIPKEMEWENIIIKNSKWAYPKEASYKKQLRNVYKNHGMYQKWASELKKHVQEKYEKEKVLSHMRRAILGEGICSNVRTTENDNWIKENSEIREI
tara:strand:- start:1973 stop:3274 length:1302 start_codon:yes stop_codon:yes gene_type:complete